MKRFRSGFELVGAIVIGVAVLLTGCDSPDTPDDVSSEQQIGERVEARWKALSERDFRGAYAFETPAYRKVTPFERFVAQFGGAVDWHGAEVKGVKLGDPGDTAKVSLAIDYTAPMPTGEPYEGRRGVYEDWILAEGEWWYVRK